MAKRAQVVVMVIALTCSGLSLAGLIRTRHELAELHAEINKAKVVHQNSPANTTDAASNDKVFDPVNTSRATSSRQSHTADGEKQHGLSNIEQAQIQDPAAFKRLVATVVEEIQKEQRDAKMDEWLSYRCDWIMRNLEINESTRQLASGPILMFLRQHEILKAQVVEKERSSSEFYKTKLMQLKQELQTTLEPLLTTDQREQLTAYLKRFIN